jgi:AraC-like DNA-binding protein
MLTDTNFDNYSLLGIAEDAGFNSKSSFNRIFKKETGMTPTQYKILHGSDSVSGR